MSRNGTEPSYLLGPAAEAESPALVSPRTGIVTHVTPFVSESLPRTMTARSAFPARVDLLPGVEQKPFTVAGFGVGTSSGEAWSSAVGETIERYGAVVGGQHVRIEWGTYREFEGEALHGDELVLPSSSEISPPYVPFDEDAPRRWVPGEDLTLGQRVLIPAQLVLPSYRPRSGAERLSPGTTSGLAAHTDESAAVLAGLREVEERDAFFIRHLNRWTPPEMPVTGICDDVDRLLASVPRWQPSTVRAWDLTLDLGQPVVMAGVFSRGQQLPPINLGTACRGDYRSALRKAVLEAFQIAAVMAARGFPQAATPEPLTAAADPEDHFRLSCLPGYLDSLDWLLDEHADWAPPGRLAECATLSAAVAAVSQRGLRVITVDLTPPDVRELGWHVCRVLVPGAQPMTFGRIRRLNGRRLFDLPVELGHRRERAREDDLNPVPHPFA
jgi:ribosomal protein S12 methylthiotransferase accessory factor